MWGYNNASRSFSGPAKASEHYIQGASLFRKLEGLRCGHPNYKTAEDFCGIEGGPAKTVHEEWAVLNYKVVTLVFLYE